MGQFFYFKQRVCLQHAVWHYGGGTLEPSAVVRYSSAVSA